VDRRQCRRGCRAAQESVELPSTAPAHGGAVFLRHYSPPAHLFQDAPTLRVRQTPRSRSEQPIQCGNLVKQQLVVLRFTHGCEDTRIPEQVGRHGHCPHRSGHDRRRLRLHPQPNRSGLCGGSDHYEGGWSAWGSMVRIGRSFGTRLCVWRGSGGGHLTAAME
jgi:hypothetical protein